MKLNNFLKICCLMVVGIYLQSCHYSDLKVKIVNHSKSDMYVDGLDVYDDKDSRFVMMNVRMYCSHDTGSNYFPRVLKSGDSTLMRDKLGSAIYRIVSINVDSLNAYCNRGDTIDVTNRSWVRKLKEDVNDKTPLPQASSLVVMNILIKLLRREIYSKIR